MRQYAGPTISSLLETHRQAVDLSSVWDEFISKCMRISTAEGEGLDGLGAIVGVSRYVRLISTAPARYFGFANAVDPDHPERGPFGFNQAPFYSGAVTYGYRLDDAQYRKLIKAKAATNIANCSILTINAILREVFGGEVYLRATGNMSFDIVFRWNPSDVERTIALSDSIPRKIGAKYTVVVE